MTFKTKGITKALSIAAMCFGLTACGGGGGDDGSPAAYKETTPGPGSTVVDAGAAVTGGTINYSHYNTFNATIGSPTWTTSSVLATVNFNATTKAGSIQFPALGGTALISTSDGYATTSWNGPFTSGLYLFNGNVIMGCNPQAAFASQVTQVFVSSSLERIQGGGALDTLDGLSFDVFDCALMQNSKVETMQIHPTEGSFTWSRTPYVMPRNEKIGMLNPGSNGSGSGGFMPGPGYHGFIGGYVFRYGKNGVNKYVIVFQIGGHYYIAVQK